MVIFRKKKIVTVESLGEDLQRARQALNLSLLAVEKKLGISQSYLEALENNEWDLVPGEIYLRNFLKKYTDFLGIEWGEVKEKYEGEIRREKDLNMDKKTRFGISRTRSVVWPRLIRNALVVLLVLAIVGYLGWQLARLISPPDLEILYPEESFISRASVVKILGRVEDESWVGLNGEEISVGNDGYFTVDINLNKGLNIIKIEAKKRYGRGKAEYRRIIVE